MKKYEWADVIPDFDVLKWKQEVQAEIYREIKFMTSSERIAYFRKGSEEFRKEQKYRRDERESRKPDIVSAENCE
jgi:hypothetical protein